MKIQRDQVRFWDSCWGNRGHQEIDHFAWTIRQPICSGTPEDRRATSTSGHLNSALLAVSDESRCHDPHPQWVSKAHSSFNSPIWPVHKSDREWRLTVDYHALNEVTPPLSIAVPDMLELTYELESKAAKWYALLILLTCFSPFLWP